MIGGGYATGREIVSYGAKYGAKGWIAGIGIMIGFAILAVLTFEVARVYKTYDYKSMIKVLIGPLWPLFDVVYILCMILVISIMASASGSIVEQTTGLNYWAGVVLLVAITGGLIFFGDSIFLLSLFFPSPSSNTVRSSECTKEESDFCPVIEL